MQSTIFLPFGSRSTLSPPTRWVIGLVIAGSAVSALVVASIGVAPGVNARAQSAASLEPFKARRAAARLDGAQSPAARYVNVGAQRFKGRVGPNLTASLLAAGVPEPAGRQYVSVLARAIDLRCGLSVDDSFDLVLERDTDGKLGQLLYVGLDRVARADVELLKWTDGKHLIWVNADGVGGEDSSGIALPVHGRLTSPFGERYHPILGYVRMHQGVDLAAAAGTPIVAAADGKVVGAGWHGGYGQQVEIAHPSGLKTSYGHMSRIAAHMGQVVTKGQVIGWVGSTGLSTGPHVHFEVTRNGRPVNPLSVKMESGPGHLQGEKLELFDATLRAVLLGSQRPS